MDLIKEQYLKNLSDTKSRLELWGNVINDVGASTIAEIGVWKGDFAKVILKRSKDIKKYYMIDPWAQLPDWNKPFNVSMEKFDEIYLEAMKNVSFASDTVEVLRGTTKEVIKNIPDKSLDFAYVDGDHTLRGITIDLITLLPKMKEKGLIAGDDFVNTPWQHNINFEPTLVCPFSIYFAEAMDLPIVALPHNQFLIQNNSDAKFSFHDYTGNYGDISLNKIPEQPVKFHLEKLKSKLLRKIRIN